MSSPDFLDLFFALSAVTVDHGLPHLSINLPSYSHVSHLHPLLMLLRILFDPLDSSDGSSFPKKGAIFDDHLTTILRKDMLSQWLTRMITIDIPGMPCLSALLSGNSKRASEVARSQSNYNLALLISMAKDQNLTRRQLLREQVDIWQSLRVQSNFPKEVWLVYQLLAGNVDAVITDLQQKDQDARLEGCTVDWILGFALFLYYSAARHDSIMDVFKRFWASQGGQLKDSRDPILGLLFLHSFGRVDLESAITIDPLHWVILTLLGHFKDYQIQDYEAISLKLVSLLQEQGLHRHALLVAMLACPDRDLYIRLAENVEDEGLSSLHLPRWLIASAKVAKCASFGEKFDTLLEASHEPNYEALIQAHALLCEYSIANFFQHKELKDYFQKLTRTVDELGGAALASSEPYEGELVLRAERSRLVPEFAAGAQLFLDYYRLKEDAPLNARLVLLSTEHLKRLKASSLQEQAVFAEMTQPFVLRLLNERHFAQLLPLAPLLTDDQRVHIARLIPIDY